MSHDWKFIFENRVQNKGFTIRRALINDVILGSDAGCWSNQKLKNRNDTRWKYSSKFQLGSNRWWQTIIWWAAEPRRKIESILVICSCKEWLLSSSSRIRTSNSDITVMIIIKASALLYCCWFWYFMWFTSQLFEILKQARDYLFITSIQGQSLLPQSESSQIKVAEIPWQSKSFIAAGNDSLIHCLIIWTRFGLTRT